MLYLQCLNWWNITNNLPENSKLLPSCCARNLDTFHGRHKQAVEVLYPHCHVDHYGLKVSKAKNSFQDIPKVGTWSTWTISVHSLTYISTKEKEIKTCIIPGWFWVLFPGHGVPSLIIHPSQGTFWNFTTKELIWILNSSYCLWRQTKSENM